MIFGKIKKHSKFWFFDPKTWNFIKFCSFSHFFFIFCKKKYLFFIHHHLHFRFPLRAIRWMCSSLEPIKKNEKICENEQILMKFTFLLKKSKIDVFWFFKKIYFLILWFFEIKYTILIKIKKEKKMKKKCENDQFLMQFHVFFQKN